MEGSKGDGVYLAVRGRLQATTRSPFPASLAVPSYPPGFLSTSWTQIDVLLP